MQGRNYRGCSRCGCTWAHGSRGPIAGAHRHIYVNLNSLNSQVALPKILTSVISGIRAQGEGAWWRLAMYPDNCTYLSVIGRISVRGEGPWRWRLQTRTRVQAHQWAANYFLVRMVDPGTKPVENPCHIGSVCGHI